MFRFESPICLILIFLLPALYFFKKRFRPSGILRTPLFDFKTNTPLFFKIDDFIKYLIIFLLVIAASNPQTGEKKSYFDSKGVNIIIALDTSGSMKALDMDDDFKKNRLDAVKSVVSEFIQKRNGDRIGVVIFGTHAFTLVPLTRDYKSINYFMDKILIGMAGENTAIGDAIAISAKRLEDIKSRTNIIILLTDGKSNSGEIPPVTAAEAALKRKIKIYSIGIGSNGYAPFPARDFFGREVIRKGRVELDEETLGKISSITGGKYFNGRNKDDLKEIYEKIDSLEKTTVKVESWKKDKDFYLWFLVSGAVLFFLRLILTHTRFLKIP